jgi:hypothetical protein
MACMVGAAQCGKQGHSSENVGVGVMVGGCDRSLNPSPCFGLLPVPPDHGMAVNSSLVCNVHAQRASFVCCIIL